MAAKYGQRSCADVSTMLFWFTYGCWTLLLRGALHAPDPTVTTPLPLLNPLTSVSHWSGFKVKLTFHEIQFFGSILYTGQILGILCLQIDLFLIVECIWYNLGHMYMYKSMYGL